VYLSFKVDGTPEYGELVVATPEQARALVGVAKANGYDFIKVYNNLAPDVFKAFVDEGRKQGLPVVGHGVTRVGIEKQLAEGQVMVAHAEEYFYTVFFQPGADVGSKPPRLDQIPGAIAFTKKYHAFVTADLNTYATIARQWGKPDVVTGFLAMPSARYLDPDQRVYWRYEGYAKKSGSLDARVRFLKIFIKDMADAGIPLIAGTDTPSIPGLVPGYSLRQDLHALEDAGLTRFQTLSTATRTAGDFIAQTKPGEQHFGTIAVGNRADLLLCATNPLSDLSAIDAPLGVMAKGRWYDAAALKNLLDGVAKKYSAAALPDSQ
jgi:hypothetical protein